MVFFFVHVHAGSDTIVDLSGSLGALPSSQREVVERYLQEKLEMMVQVSVYKQHGCSEPPKLGICLEHDT